jgi:5-formyltetrahydrofolate cyclo-ligase
MNPAATQKNELRARLLARRGALDPARVRDDSRDAARLLLADPLLRRADCVLLYLPVKNELDTRDIFAELAGRGATVLLPRCRDGETGELDLFHVACLNEVCPGRFGILEPDPARCRKAEATPPDAAVVPGVAFDRRGFRLGFGGGYYDRLFARRDMAATLRIGLGYDFQVVETLPTESWDRPMHALCTPKELTWIRP